MVTENTRNCHSACTVMQAFPFVEPRQRVDVKNKPTPLRSHASMDRTQL